MYWVVFISCHIFLFVKNLVIRLHDTAMTFLKAEEVMVVLSLGTLWRGSEARGYFIDDTEKVNAIWHYCISFSDVEQW